MSAEGNISRQVNAGTFVGGTGADIVMANFILPPNTFDISGRGIQITALGSFLSDGSNKTVKIVFNPSTAVLTGTLGGGGVTVATTGVVTAGGSGWSLTAQVFKYGILGSNTQLCLHQQAQVGAVVEALVAPQLATANEAGPILVALTGNGSILSTDITWNFLEINAMN
jgi:hypothetical protein